MRARIGPAERPFAERVEVAVDHRLDVDARLAGADDDAGDPAAGVRDARAAAALYSNAPVGSGIDLQPELLEKGAAGKEFALPLLGAESGIAAPITRAEPTTRRSQIQRVDAGDGYAGLPCHRRKTRLALVPPKPRLLLITAPSVAWRVLSTIGRPRIAGSGSSRLTQPAMKPRPIIRRQ